MILNSLNQVKKRIEDANNSSDFNEKITLIAVTKTHPVELINEAINLGVTDIGENKVQEILEKYDRVLPVNWHLIGHLQTNKVKYIIDKVCMIHSVDSVKLLDEINRLSKKNSICMDVLIQVNISGEVSKFGISPNQLDSLLFHAENLDNVKVKGLMTIAPKTDNQELNGEYFKQMRSLFDKYKNKKIKNVNMEYLSMGMSGDYETAIVNGSNMVRVGSAIFGKRYYDLI